jgi:hypothetical protein
MNNFLKGFFSIFNLFPSSKSYDEITKELDNKMQDLYDRMGWGKYNNPCSAHNTAGDLTRSISSDEWNNMVKDNKSAEEVYGNVRIVTSSQFLDEMIKLVPSGSFHPYAYYNADMDSIQVYFKDTDSYTQPLNQNVEIHLSHDTDEITGATILNIRQLIGDQK